MMLSDRPRYFGPTGTTSCNWRHLKKGVKTITTISDGVKAIGGAFNFRK